MLVSSNAADSSLLPIGYWKIKMMLLPFYILLWNLFSNQQNIYRIPLSMPDLIMPLSFLEKWIYRQGIKYQYCRLQFFSVVLKYCFLNCQIWKLTYLIVQNPYTNPYGNELSTGRHLLLLLQLYKYVKLIY